MLENMLLKKPCILDRENWAINCDINDFTIVYDT